MQRLPAGQGWLLPVRFADCKLPEFDLGPGRTLDSIQRVDLFAALPGPSRGPASDRVHRVRGGGCQDGAIGTT